MKKLIIAVLVMSWASPVWAAAFTNGNDLYEKCTVEKSSNVYYMDYSWCQAYIIGAADALTGPDIGVGGFTFCIPIEVTQLQVQDIVKKWLSNHPQNRHYSAHSLVASALSEVWPCSE